MQVPGVLQSITKIVIYLNVNGYIKIYINIYIKESGWWIKNNKKSNNIMQNIQNQVVKMVYNDVFGKNNIKNIEQIYKMFIIMFISETNKWRKGIM